MCVGDVLGQRTRTLDVSASYIVRRSSGLLKPVIMVEAFAGLTSACLFNAGNFLMLTFAVWDQAVVGVVNSVSEPF